MRLSVRHLALVALHAVCLARPLPAQPGPGDLARSMMAGAGAALSPRPHLASAGGAGANRISLSAVRLYGLPELQPVHGSVERQIGKAVSVAMEIDALSLEGYARHGFAISAGFGRGHAGARVTLKALRTRAGRYPAIRSVFPALAVRARVAPSIDAGLRVDAPPDAGDPDRNRNISLGIAWRASPSLEVCLDRTRSTPSRAGTSIGLSWDAGTLVLYAGWSSAPAFRAMGLVAAAGSTRLGLLLSFHDPLGWTPGVGVEWR